MLSKRKAPKNSKMWTCTACV